jgi:hypothetical protein
VCRWGYNDSVAREVETEQEGWITLEALSGPVHLNSMTLAKVAITAMESRPHSNAALAAINIMEYRMVACCCSCVGVCLCVSVCGVFFRCFPS